MPDIDFTNTMAYIEALAGSYKVPIITGGTFDEKAMELRLTNLQQMVDNVQTHVVGSNKSFTAYSAAAVNNIVQGFTTAGLAFQQGNNARGGVEIARSFASVCTTVANFSKFFPKAAGPAGIALTIMGEALSFAAFLIDTIVGQKAEDKEEALLQNIEHIIRTVYAEKIEDHLIAMIEALKTGGAVLEKTACGSPQSLTKWQEVVDICPTLSTGLPFVELIDTESWLLREANQRLEIWENIFDAYCNATARQLQNYGAGLLALKTNLSKEEWGRLDDPATPPDEKERLKQVGDTADKQRAQAMTVVSAYQKNRLDWFNAIRPRMVNNVNTWRIGKDRHLYTRGQTFAKGEDPKWNYVGSSRFNFEGHRGLAPGLGDRIWCYANAGNLFTRTLSDAPEHFDVVPDYFAQEVVDFCVVSEDKDPKDGPIGTVYSIQHGQVISFNWDEAKHLAYDRILYGKGTVPTSLPRAIAVGTVEEDDVVTDEDGAVKVVKRETRLIYLLVNDHFHGRGSCLIQYIWRPWRSRDRRSESTQPSEVYRNARLAENRKNLFVYGGNCGTKILVIPHHLGIPTGAADKAAKDAFPGNGSDPYHIPGPGADLGLPAGWVYNSVFASDDESIVAITNEYACRWVDGKWSVEPDRPGERFDLCTRPVSGWQTFLGLRDLVSDTVKSAS
jgi:hypothetical protein